MKEKPKNIILTGVKHCGKSTFGKAIAAKLDYAFFDLDGIIEDLNQGRNVREIFASEGERKFRAAETRAAAWLSGKMDFGRVCAALGGSTVENPEAVQLLGPRGLFFYLHVKPDTLFKRVMRTGVPPFLSAANAYEEFMALYRQRDTLYRQTADIVIDLDGLDIGQGETRILDSLKNML
jgi:shikimate kinase